MSNILGKYLLAYKNKLTNKLFGVVSVPHQGKKKGVVLLSFLTGPFTHTPAEYFTDPHSNNWVSPEIARLFAKRGYDVDVINWNNNLFVPKKKYVACVDMQYSLGRLSQYLPPECTKIMHIVSSYPQFQNNAENKRLQELKERRGVSLPPKRTDPTTSNPQCADFIEGYGNRTVHGTYPLAGKKITPIPIPSMEEYAFPDNKDFAATRKHFLWFGGGGAILKGLDLVIEVFASLPHLQLSIIGPSAYEKEFEEIYKNELNLPNITRYGRPRVDKNGEITVEGRNLLEIFNQCGATIFLSASEGGSGAVVHAMQAGLYPIVTPQSGISEDAPSTVVENPTIENVRKIVEEFSQITPEKLEELSKNSWLFAREHYTKKAFTTAYENFLDNIVKLK